MTAMAIVSLFLCQCRFNCAGTGRALVPALCILILFPASQAGAAGQQPASTASAAAEAGQPMRPGTGAPPKPSEERAEDPNGPPRVNELPENGRPVSFEVDEGTWMNLTLSPDGKTILFDLLGDLYALPALGGEARRLTSGPAYDWAPRFSPDGRMVAFLSDRGGNQDLWLMSPDGTGARQITADKEGRLSSPAWTPDGMYIVARREITIHAGIPPVELWLYHRDGGQGVPLVTKEKLNNSTGPVVSPQGRFIYLSGRRARFSYTPAMSSGLWQLHRYDRRTGELFQITAGVGGAARPMMSPDGHHLYYLHRVDASNQLIERDLRTGAERTLAEGLTRDEQEGFTAMDLYPAYAPTPDGSAIVLWNRGKIWRLDLQTRQMREIPFRARVEQTLRPMAHWEDRIEDGPLSVRILLRPMLTPDGRTLIFEALGKLWRQRIDNFSPAGAPERLTRSSRREYAPAASPDGRWVAYVSWSDGEGGHVWKVRSRGGRPVRLSARAARYANPAWSPQGDRLVVVMGTGAELRGQQPEDDLLFEIRWLPAEPEGVGSEARLVRTTRPANTLVYHPNPVFGPQGRRIYYTEHIKPSKPDEPNKVELVSVRLDGTDLRRHLRFISAENLTPSPDGLWVAFTSRDNVHVTTLPEAGAEPVEISFTAGAVPVLTLSREGGGFVSWSDAGKSVTWGFANTFYRQSLERARSFRLEQIEKKRAKKAEKEAGVSGEAGGEAQESDQQEPPEPKLPPVESFDVNLQAARARPGGALLLRGGRIITMRGDEVLAEADILVDGNRIAAVGRPGSFEVPAGTVEIDVSGKTILPGFVDIHAHMHYSSFEIFPDKKWEYIANLAYGVTTTHDPSAPSLDVFAQAEMVETGELLGPRIYSSGHVLYGGDRAPQFARVSSYEDALAHVRRMKRYGARWIKVYEQPRREQRLWFAHAARAERVMLTAEGAGEQHKDLTLMIDGYTGVEHSLPLELFRDQILFAAAAKTYYTPTLLVSYGGPWGELYFHQTVNPHDDPKLNRFTPHAQLDRLGRRRPWIPEEEYHFPTVARGAAEVARAGGNVCLGAHGQVQGLGVHWELWALGMGGMSPMEALRTATLTGAEALGFGRDLGSVEAGKLADLVVLNRNPLEDLRNSVDVAYVVTNGFLYRAETMDQIWPERRPLEPFYWQHRETGGRATLRP